MADANQEHYPAIEAGHLGTGFALSAVAAVVATAETAGVVRILAGLGFLLSSLGAGRLLYTHLDGILPESMYAPGDRRQWRRMFYKVEIWRQLAQKAIGGLQSIEEDVTFSLLSLELAFTLTWGALFLFVLRPYLHSIGGLLLNLYSGLIRLLAPS